MDHEYALRAAAVEKYLLNELPQDERDSFEEHFFDCPECSRDLRAGILLLDQVKKELASYPVSHPVAQPLTVQKPRFRLFWRPSFAMPIFAALVAVVAYQNAVFFPKLAREAASQNAPQILPTLSLAAANSRGDETPSIGTDGKAFLLLFDIPGETPGQAPFTNYICSLYSPSGALLWQTAVSTEQAKDTVSLRVPDPRAGAGIYRLAVEGTSGQNRTELASYRFRIGQRN